MGRPNQGQQRQSLQRDAQVIEDGLTKISQFLCSLDTTGRKAVRQIGMKFITKN